MPLLDLYVLSQTSKWKKKLFNYDFICARKSYSISFLEVIYETQNLRYILS